MDNGILEVGVALEFGLRICHFSFLGGENVFYEHPLTLDRFTTPEGWRLRGGHRLWLAPEGEDVYAPDNNPIRYTLLEDGIALAQERDARLGVIKQMQITFEGDRICVMHRITNVGDSMLERALWPISVMAAGGVEHIALPTRNGGYDPLHHISIWDHSNLGDPRATYKKDEIILTHMDIDCSYKIGVGHPKGEVRYTNRGVVFFKDYLRREGANYPDGSVSYETFLSKFMVELESLSPLYRLQPGESAEHTEYWRLALEKEEE